MKEFKLSNINPYTLARDFFNNILLYVMAFFIGVCGINIYSEVIYEPVYTSTMTVSVSKNTQYSRFYDDLSSTIEIAEVLKNVFSSEVLKLRVEDQTQAKFTGEITSSVIPETNFITITVTEKTPQKAFDALVAVYDNYDKVFNNSVFENTRTNVISSPTVPARPSNVKIDGSFGKKIGLLLAGVVALSILFFSFIRDTVKQPSDVENSIDGELIGVIYHEKIKKKQRVDGTGKSNLLIVSNPLISYGFSEAIKKIEVKVYYKLKGKHAKRVLVTSVDQHEGKSTISTSLAVQIIKENPDQRVLLVDADLRKPAVPHFFSEINFEKEHSLFSYLKGELSIKDIIFHDEDTGLDIISSHTGHMQSAEVLHKGRFRELLDAVQDSYDFIVIDTPPMSLVADTEQIADLVDLSLLVLSQDRMPVPEINETIDVLNASNSEFFGCILNNVRTLSGYITKDHGVAVGDKYGYGRSYNYGYDNYYNKK